MPLTKRIGFGVTLSCDPAGGTTYALLGAVVEGIDGADAKATVIETALLTDKYQTKAVGQVDSGEVSFTIAYDPADTATTTVLTGLLTSGVSAGWEISYPIIAAETQQTDAFQGPLSGMKRTVSKDKMILATVTIAVSGKPGLKGT